MHSEILTKLMSIIPSSAGMELPPKVSFYMQCEFLEFVEGEKLVARYPNLEHYMNPFGFMQGGMIIAAMDNTVSPLSYVVGPPNISSRIEASFKRPVKGSDAFIDVIATVAHRSDSGISLQATVLNASGKQAATGMAHCVFLRDSRAPHNGG